MRGVVHLIGSAVIMWPVPNQPKTPVRSFRIPDAIYDPARAKAEAEGTTLTDVVKDALLEYVGDEDWP